MKKKMFKWIGLLQTLCLLAPIAKGDKGRLIVIVEDPYRRPVKGIEIGVEGIGGSGLTGDDGKVALTLGAATKPGDLVTLIIIHSPKGKDLAIFSPYDYRTVVPQFEDKSENVVKLFVTQRGDREALENGSLVRSLTEQINKANEQRSPIEMQSDTDPRKALEATAKNYGIDPDELDRRIRAQGEISTDPYTIGLAALYERDYPKATVQLYRSVSQRERRVIEDQKTFNEDRNGLADAASFLGSSLYQEGKYSDSVAAYRKCLQYRPNDLTASVDLALSLEEAGEYRESEPIYRSALDLEIRSYGPDNFNVAATKNNLAVLLNRTGRYSESELLAAQSLSTNQSIFGPESEMLVANLTVLGLDIFARGDFREAEKLLRRALVIRESQKQQDILGTASSLGNLGNVLVEQGKYAEAESLERKALDLETKQLGRAHFTVGNRLNCLAEVLRKEGRYDEAEDRYRQALEIEEKAVGADHPGVASILSNLGLLLGEEMKFEAAEPLIRRALEIDERTLDVRSPLIAIRLSNLGTVLLGKKDNQGAEEMYQRALAIDEAAFGENNREVAHALDNLATVYLQIKDLNRAERLFDRALDIDERYIGDGNPQIGITLSGVAMVLYFQGNHRGALIHMRRSISLLTKILGPEHPIVKQSIEMYMLMQSNSL